ncbi:flagellar filament capping protein FliD [bacterium]|nr:flagellar filament capping protein FliD [bacterium]
MSVQFLGIASGTDWGSYIDALVQVQSAAKNKLEAQLNKLEYDRAIMSAVNDQLADFNTTLSTLRFESTFLSRLAESSDAGSVSAVAQAGATVGSYSVIINRLAAASRATSGLDGEIFSKVVNLAGSETIGLANMVPYDDFQETRALSTTLIKNTVQAGKYGAEITAGDTITITGTLKDGVTNVSGTFTFAGDETDTLERLAVAIAQVFQGEIAASVGSTGELVLLETNPSVAGDVTFNTTIPPLDLQFNDTDYSGSTLDFGIGNIVAGGAAVARRLVNDQLYTSGGAPVLLDTTDLATLDQVTGTLGNGDIIRITGTERDGSAIASTDFTYTGAAGGQTIADLIATISGAFTTATATYENGRIVLTDTAAGASQISISLAFVDQGLATEFDLGEFEVGEVGRDATSQMVTTASFTVEGTGEHLLSSTTGKAGQITGTLMITDPSNTLESWMLGATNVFDMLSIDADGTAGPLEAVRIEGLNEYSTIQDLIDAINAQVPGVTAQLVDNGTSYNFQITANQGGTDIRVYDDANGVLQILGPGNPTDIDSSVPDTYSTAATTDTDDATLVAWYQPDNGGPMQRRIWTGDEGVAVEGLIGGVAIIGNGGAFDDGVATIVTANSDELNTEQEMYTYIFGDDDIVTTSPTHHPPFDPSLSLAEAGFATTPLNASTSPLNHTDGFFTINGTRVNVGDVNTMTVNELLGTINASGAGVTAFFDTATGRFYLRSNTSGAEDIDLGGGGDTSNFLTIAGLTTEAGGVVLTGQAKGNIDIDLPISEAGFAATLTAGVFTINNTKITIDTGVDSLTDIIKKINNSGAGVIATYDPVADKFTLAQDLDKNPTAYRITVGAADDTSNFLEAVQLTTDTTVPTLIGSVRQTAKFSVNGVSYTRNSNTVDDVIDDVELSLNAVTTGSETISITSDTDKIQEAILDFVVAYNKTMELLNGQPLSTEERERTAELTDEDAATMSTDEIEDYLVEREELLIREFVSRDATVRQITRKIINYVQGLVTNDGLFQSLGQIGLATAEVGSGVAAATTMQGRLLAPTSDRNELLDYIEANADLQEAIRNNDEDLFKLFANVLTSTLTHQGSRNLSGGIAVSDNLNFTISDGVNTASINFTSGTYTQNTVMNRINQQILNAGMSDSVLAYFDSNNQLNIKVAKADTQAYLQLQDYSTGSDSVITLLGLQTGSFFGPDPDISGGVALRTREYLNNITKTGGIVMERLKQNGSFDRQIDTINEAITRQEMFLADYEQQLRDKFARLETTLSGLQTQSDSVEAAIAQWLKSSNND